MPATVKPTLRAALASLVLAALLAGCGGGSHAAITGTSATTNPTGATAPTASAPTPTTPTKSTSSSSSSSTTSEVANPVTYGHLAGASEKAAVTRVVEAYYAALSSGHEVAACGMLTPRLRHLVDRSVGRNPLLHGRGCVGAFKLLFGHHGGASSVSPTVAVTGVRIGGDRAYALFSTQSIPSAQIRVEREHGVWKIGSLIGAPVGGPSGSSGG